MLILDFFKDVLDFDCGCKAVVIVVQLQACCLTVHQQPCALVFPSHIILFNRRIDNDTSLHLISKH